MKLFLFLALVAVLVTRVRGVEPVRKSDADHNPDVLMQRSLAQLLRAHEAKIALEILENPNTQQLAAKGIYDFVSKNKPIVETWVGQLCQQTDRHGFVIDTIRAVASGGEDNKKEEL